MVLHYLYIKAELENVASVKLRQDANLCLSVKNPLSNWEVREKVVINASEPLEQEDNAREPAHHLSLKWEGSKKASIAMVLGEAATKTALKKKRGAVVKRQYEAEDSGKWVAILALECRGLEPYAFFPLGEDFVVVSTGGKEFSEDVDFSAGDYVEYDEENDGRNRCLATSPVLEPPSTYERGKKHLSPIAFTEPVSLSDIEFKWEGA